MPENKRKPSNDDPKPPVLVLAWEVLKEVILSIGLRRAEAGGAIGGKEDGAEVSHYHFDESSRNSAVTYTPDYKFLNGLFKDHWNPEGIRLRGFIHSHPGRSSRPSYGDEVYAERILDAIEDLASLWLPIVNTLPDTGEFRFTPWLARRNANGVHVVRGQVRIVEMPCEPPSGALGEVVLDSLRPDVVLAEIVLPFRQTPAAARAIAVASTTTWKECGDDDIASRDEPCYENVQNAVASQTQATASDVTGAIRVTESVCNPTSPQAQEATDEARCGAVIDLGTTFDRVREAYDLEVMRSGRIIAVGAGGAASWLEELARAGLGQFILIDADVVSETNLATQQTYRRDIGRPKVDCIAERIRDINPSARTIAIQKNLDTFIDEPVVLSDDVIERLAFTEIDGRRPARTVTATSGSAKPAVMRSRRSPSSPKA